MIRLRLSLNRSLAALAVAAVASVSACSSSEDSSSSVKLRDGAPAYCQKLAELPSGLLDAVADAASGNLSDGDKATIAKAIAQLRDAADDKEAANLKPLLADAASSLDKLASGAQFGTDEVISFGTTFEKLGSAVNDACAAK